MADIRVEDLIPGVWVVFELADGKHIEYGRIRRTRNGMYEAYADDASCSVQTLAADGVTFGVKGPCLGSYNVKKVAVDMISLYANSQQNLKNSTSASEGKNAP